jgi:ElaA protein
MSLFVWQSGPLSALSPQQLYAVLAARQAVFVVEQNCPYQDADGTDFKADHLIAWAGDEVAGYARIYGPEIKFPEPSIGRILTTQRFRGTGLGREVVARSIARIEQLYPRQNIRIGAQARLERFYNSFGFVTASTEYMEDGIPHIEMLRVAVRPAASHL